MPVATEGRDAGDMLRDAFACSGPAGPLTLRPVEAEDDGFLLHLFSLAHAHTPRLPDMLMQMQFTSRRAASSANHPYATHLILARAGQPAGALDVDLSSPHHTHLIDIAVLPQAQRQGLGSRMLHAWLLAADRLALRASLCVDPGNPALSLYHRVGFAVEDADAMPMRMYRPARPLEPL